MILNCFCFLAVLLATPILSKKLVIHRFHHNECHGDSLFSSLYFIVSEGECYYESVDLYGYYVKYTCVDGGVERILHPSHDSTCQTPNPGPSHKKNSTCTSSTSHAGKYEIHKCVDDDTVEDFVQNELSWVNVPFTYWYHYDAPGCEYTSKDSSYTFIFEECYGTPGMIGAKTNCEVGKIEHTKSIFSCETTGVFEEPNVCMDYEFMQNTKSYMYWIECNGVSKENVKLMLVLFVFVLFFTL